MASMRIMLLRLDRGTRKKVAQSIMYQDKPEETSWDKGKCYAEFCGIAQVLLEDFEQ